MPMFYFDTDDELFRQRDEIGQDLADAEAMRLVAIASLPDLARNPIPDGDRRVYSVNVRDHSGARVYTTSLTLRGRWPNQGGALDGVADVLIEALDMAEQEADEISAEMIRKILQLLGETLAERVGRKAAGIKLN